MASEEQGERVSFNAQYLASLTSERIAVDLVSDLCRQLAKDRALGLLIAASTARLTQCEWSKDRPEGWCWGV
jgi:hypothetical protein|tara:strand:+ start:23346 stop:23561 length:216 start_codon:yes stop_codon:yes gene_type:complete